MLLDVDLVAGSENTIKTHLQTIFTKLGVRNRVEAAMVAAKNNLI